MTNKTTLRVAVLKEMVERGLYFPERVAEYKKRASALPEPQNWQLIKNEAEGTDVSVIFQCTEPDSITAKKLLEYAKFYRFLHMSFITIEMTLTLTREDGYPYLVDLLSL